jgi:7SK snRNA methylphosphate capping enzyme
MLSKIYFNIINIFNINRNINFENIDILKKSFNENEKYDIITCFSVTKWIHLNNGDEGIKNFFNKVYNTLENEGIFIYEPQPYKSYKKKQYLYPKEMLEILKNIKFRPKDFDEYIIKLGFDLLSVDYSANNFSNSFSKRKIKIFKKK